MTNMMKIERYGDGGFEFAVVCSECENYDGSPVQTLARNLGEALDLSWDHGIEEHDMVTVGLGEGVSVES